MKTPAHIEMQTSARTGKSYPHDSAIGQIKAALERGESLTPMDALRRFGCSRLAAVAHKLKRDGLLIDADIVSVETGHGKTAHVARYKLAGAS